MKLIKSLMLLAGVLWLATGAFGAPVDDQTAASAVKGWLRFNRQPLGAMLGGTVKNVETFKDKTDAPVYHVVNLEPSGFVIVSAEDQLEPIIAFVDQGRFDPSLNNPLGALVSRDLPVRVAQARARGALASKSTSRQWQKLTANSGGGGVQPMGISSGALSDLRVAPFINTCWDQGNLPTVVTNWIWITNEIVIRTHFVADSLGNLVNTSATCPANYGSFHITNGPSWPVVHSFGGNVVTIDINNGPGTTVTNLVTLTETAIIVVTNEFGDVVGNQTPVWVGNTIITDIVSGTTGNTVTHSIWVTNGYIMVVNDFKACYNYFTPPHGPGNINNRVNTNNYYCGCVATAMAQLMYYFQYPSTGVGTPCFQITVDGNPLGRNLLGGDYKGGPYDWKDMPLTPDYYSLTPLQAQSVGALTCDAGLAVKMAYTASESGAYMNDAKTALVSTFKYNNAVVNFVTNLDTGCFECNLYNMMNPNLDARLPVLLGITGDPGGHAIVVDGYGYNFGALYHHLNMGWSGMYNAWYALPIIDMELPDGSYSYFWQVTQCIYNVYTNGSGEIISGRVVDPGTNPVVGASITATLIGSGSTYTAVTDAKGIYALTELPSGSAYTLTVTNTGYAPASADFSTGTSYDDGAASGNVWGANFTLIPAVGPPVIKLEPANQAITLGGNATFSISVTGALPMSYQWQIQTNDGSLTWYNLSDGGSISGSTTATLTITQPDLATYNGAPFQCVVINGSGSVTSSPPAVLSISASPYLTITTLAGSAGNSGSIDGLNNSALFNNPRGIAVDNNTNVYVADMYNHVIRKLTLSGADWAVTTIAGLAGSSGNTDGINSNARFNGPYGLVVNGGGTVIYVADTGNNTVRKLTLSGTNWVVSTIAGLAGSSGSTDGTNGSSRFRYPIGIARDSTGNLYVTDEGNNTIRKLAPSGTNWVASTIAGKAGYSGSTDGVNVNARFNAPYGIAVDGSGNIYVADKNNCTIRRVKLVGGNWTVTTIAGLAYNSGSADGLGIPTARFASPTGVAVDGGGNFYVADLNNTIRWLTPVGTNWIVLTVAGSAGNSGSADGPGNSVRFNGPYAIAVGSCTNVYVADSLNNTIRGTPLTTVTLPGVIHLVRQTVGDKYLLTWQATCGHTYQIQFKTNFNQAAWNPLTNVAASSWTGVASIPIGSDPQRYYRIVP